MMHGYNDEITQCWPTDDFIALVWAVITQPSGKDLSQGGVLSFRNWHNTS